MNIHIIFINLLLLSIASLFLISFVISGTEIPGTEIPLQQRLNITLRQIIWSSSSNKYTGVSSW